MPVVSDDDPVNGVEGCPLDRDGDIRRVSVERVPDQLAQADDRRLTGQTLKVVRSSRNRELRHSS
jgi:hypothetical protein